MSDSMYAGVRLPVVFVAIAAFSLAPKDSLACACGCGVFDVGTSSMLPTHEGGMVWFEYDFMNQNRNWHGNSSAPADNNDDKDIKGNFFTAGAQYMFNRSWGISGEVPFIQRHFTTTDDDTSEIVSHNHSDFGDVRIKGVYSGFSPDMSTGITFGLKLPTGDYSYSGFDRDTAIGSGSTDLLLGAYHQGHLSGAFNWYAHGELDQPVLITAGYRPGSEFNVASGVYYEGWHIGSIKIAPIAQVIGSYRLHDRGINSDPFNSGYERVLVSPGLEASVGKYRLYSDVELPVYQHIRGNQLTANALFKINISRSF